MSELNAESCFKNIMHFRDRGAHAPYAPCLSTPLFNNNHMAVIGLGVCVSLSTSSKSVGNFIRLHSEWRASVILNFRKLKLNFICPLLTLR